MRIAVIEALGTLGPAAKEAFPAVKQATQDPEYGVRWKAVAALRKIRP